MTSTGRAARAAGLLYLLSALIALVGLLYVPRALIVPGDATATADRLRASGALLRLGIASELLSAVLFVFVVLALYALFKEVGRKRALAMATLLLVSVPISCLNVLNELAARVLVGGATFLSAFEPRQLDTLAFLFLRLHAQGLLVAAIFWGLWPFPFGALVIHCGFLPRVLGVCLIIAGAGYLVSSSAALFLPQYAGPVSRFAMVLEAGELPIIFWLLIRGAKVRRIDAPAA